MIVLFSLGKGQIIDASMVEGCGYVSAWLFATKDLWIWNSDKRGENWYDYMKNLNFS